MKGDCGKRSVRAALRWAGIDEIPSELSDLILDSYDDFRKLSKHFGLEYIDVSGGSFYLSSI